MWIPKCKFLNRNLRKEVTLNCNCFIHVQCLYNFYHVTISMKSYSFVLTCALHQKQMNMIHLKQTRCCIIRIPFWELQCHNAANSPTLPNILTSTIVVTCTLFACSWSMEHHQCQICMSAFFVIAYLLIYQAVHHKH